MTTQRNNCNSLGSGRSQPQQHQWTQSPYQQPLWTTPAYPRPHQQWAYPWTPPCQYSITGAQQVHMTSAPPHMNSQQSSSSYAPTDIRTAKHTFSISPPDDQWYMDNGATCHMTGNG
ncbi:hypothetical protein A2U01_0024862, partial [Trifolium medium]|nr:hypothetical protein [Trifolium medium]